MDPLSITAGAIAVVGALSQAVKCIEKLRAIQKAPEELALLLDEVIDLKKLLEQIDPSTASLDRHEHTSGLSWQVSRASTKLHQLDHLIQQLGSESFARPRISIHSGHWKWARERKKAQTLQEELKSLRLNLATSLGESILSTVARVESAIDKVDRKQADIALSLSALLRGLHFSTHSGIEAPAEDRCPDYELTLSAQFPAENTHTTTIPPATIEKMTRRQWVPNKSDRVQMSVKRPTRFCNDWCSCRCHQKNAVRLKQPFDRVVGSISLAYSGLPLITADCDQLSCCSKSTPYIAMTFRFPSWLWNRYLSTSFAYTPVRGPDVNLRLPRTVDWGSSKLTGYAANGDIVGIQTLFATGTASPWDLTPLGGSALHYAADNRQFEVCRFLIGQGAPSLLEDDFNKSPAELAWEQVLSGRLSEDEEHAVTSIFSDTDYLQTRGFTVLHKIVLGLVPKQLGLELEYCTKDINTVDSSGRTCVSWAAERNDQGKLRTLLEYHADPHIPDNQGSTPLLFVRNTECCKILLDCGAKTDIKNRFGWTVLHQICRNNGSLSLLKMLHEAGADINAVDNSGETPFANAIFRRYTHLARYLLDNGADLEIANSSLDAPVQFAIMSNAHEILTKLLDRDVNLTKRNVQNKTILHHAAQNADLKTLSILKQADIHDIDISALDVGGMSALEYLSDNHNREFRDSFEELLRLIAARNELVTNPQGSEPVAGSAVVPQTMPLNLTKKDNVVSITPLQSDDDDDYEKLEISHGPVVFYDAWEDASEALTVEVSV